MPASSTERYHRYIEKHGKRPPRKDTRKRGNHHHPAKFKSGQFICFDGEGKNIGPVIQIPRDNGEAPDTVRAHIYNRVECFYQNQTFSLEQSDRALRSYEIMDLLCDVTARFPHATAMVGFSLGYDFTHILRDLDVKEFTELRTMSKVRGRGKYRRFKWYANNKLYLLDYQERKYLSVHVYNDKNMWQQTPDGAFKVRKPDGKFKLWDVWGFFQGTFIRAIEEWLGKDYPDLALIVKMKALRGEFERCDAGEIARYNLAEVRALSKIMTRLHTALKHPDVDLVLTRWDGAGAVAASILMKHNIKQHLQDTQTLYPAVFEAGRYAYAGGRIEMGEFGFEMRRISHADIRSAYPAAMCELPSLANGVWQSGGPGTQPPSGFTVVRLQWLFPARLKYYPLFWRSDKGSIVFPQAGEGWYWFPEYQAALAFAEHYKSNGLTVLEWLHFEPDTDYKPFAEFVRPMYSRRAELKASAVAEDGAAQIVLKLGLNSLYGKLVQQLGAEIDEDGALVKRPPYFQIEFAGYITSATRAKLLLANLETLDSVISFATDGAFSKVQGTFDEGTDLGQWEHIWHDGMFAVQPGVYATITAGKTKSYTRGYSSEGAEREIPLICEAWERGETTYRLARRLQMVTMNQGRVSPALWPYRGCFREQERTLRLDGRNAKREPIDLTKKKPAKRLVRIPVRETSGGMSRAYKLGWKAARELEGVDRSEDDYG